MATKRTIEDVTADINRLKKKIEEANAFYEEAIKDYAETLSDFGLELCSQIKKDLTILKEKLEKVEDEYTMLKRKQERAIWHAPEFVESDEE